MKRKKITIVGLGEIGSCLLRELLKKGSIFDIEAVDKNKSKFDKSLPVNYTTYLRSPADIFIITVYGSEDVLEVITKINYSTHPLVLIESTINPEICFQIEENVVALNKSYLAYFPHRYFQGDKNHQIFNQKRVLGPINHESGEKALEFLSNFMKLEDIIITSSNIAVLSKLIENSHRFVEIALAEEIAIYCNKNNLNFEELRKSVNSKWNIGMKEAKRGIGGKCLLKDIKMLNRLFEGNFLFSSAILSDKSYKEFLDKKSVKK